MPTIPKPAAITKLLSAKLGLTPTVSKPTNAIRLKHRAVPMPAPGSHAALLRKLYGGK
jgi:hypothetical protein